MNPSSKTKLDKTRLAVRQLGRSPGRTCGFARSSRAALLTACTDMLTRRLRHRGDASESVGCKGLAVSWLRSPLWVVDQDGTLVDATVLGQRAGSPQPGTIAPTPTLTPANVTRLVCRDTSA
jgi:hypothetical protein